jgi:RNA polymerase primary sigma factor
MAPRKTQMRSGAILATHDESINIYLKQIAKNAPLTSKKEAEIAALIRDGDPEAFKTLVLANLRFVVSVSLTYINQGLPLNDLINVGNVGLMRAARKFDEKKNFRFISYAVWWIRQAILQALADQSRIVRVPINRVGSIYKIEQTQRKLQQRHQRTATMQEIGEEIGMSARDVHTMLQVASRHASLDAPAEDGHATLHDKLSCDGAAAVEEIMTNLSLSREVGRSLEKLDAREREIIHLYFGIGCETSCTLDEIGQRFSLTRERVRQIKESALNKLKRPAINYGLREFYR